MKLPFRTDQQQRASSLAAFAAFDAAEWSAWIQRFSFHDTVEPEIPVYEDHYSLALIDLYKDLPAPSRLKFSKGLAQAFESLPLTQVNAEQILMMLDVLAVVKPSDSRSFLRRHLRNGTLKAVTFEGARLHTILLGVTGKYSVDSDLLELIESTPESESDFSWWLAGFRLLSYVDVQRACTFLERMLPRLDNAGPDVIRERELIVEEEIKSLVRRENSHRLWVWYMARRHELSGSQGFERFSRILVEKVLPSVRLHRPQQDSYAILAEKVLSAERRELSMVDIQEVAQLHDRVPDHDLVAAMRLLFEAAKRRTGEDPWQLVDHDLPPYNRLYSKEERGGVTVYTSDAKNRIWLSKVRDRRILQIIEGATPDYGNPIFDAPVDPREADWDI